jgi:transposase
MLPQGFNALNGAKEQPAMEYGAIDLHLRASQIRIVQGDGGVIVDRRITTSREGFVGVFEGRARMQRRVLRVREQLVRVRTQAINLLRAQLRQEGYRLGSGSAGRYTRLGVPAALHEALTPLLDLLSHLAPAVAAAGAALRTQAAADPITVRLMTAPGIGPITALTYRATVDDIARFRDAGSASAFFGLVPIEDSSGERQRRGRITKAGPPVARSLLVQAAWVVWRHRAGGAALHAWVQRLAERRGRRVAVVALARRLARILYAMWRDGTAYRGAAPAGAAVTI